MFDERRLLRLLKATGLNGTVVAGLILADDGVTISLPFLANLASHIRTT